MTGVSGYAGGVIANYLFQNGWDIRQLGSKPIQIFGNKTDFFQWRLGEHLPVEVFKDAFALIHCAWDFNCSKRAQATRTNVEGSIRLFQLARDSKIERLLFISSMSAFENSKSLYGQTKFMVENEISRMNAVSIRPGLIYGDVSGGMVGALKKIVKLLPVVPVINQGDQGLYFTHEKDLARFIEGFLKEHESSFLHKKPVIAANPRMFSMKEILRGLALSQKKRIFLLCLPWQAPWLALKILEMVGFKLRTGSDSLVSLAHQNRFPVFLPSVSSQFREWNPK